MHHVQEIKRTLRPVGRRGLQTQGTAPLPSLEQAIALRRWRRDSDLTRRAAAAELGISERMLAYYETGERPVPRSIMLAARALAAGLDEAADQPSNSRERWVTLVRNLLDYGAEIPVVGRMLKARDHQGLADFLAFVRRGPDPSLALTDPALFCALRAAVTRAQLAGLAQYHMQPTPIQAHPSPEDRISSRSSPV